MTPIEVISNIQDVQVPSCYFNPVAYKLWQNGVYGNEYFLIENREKRDNDPGIPGEGLMIYHIDESQWGNSDENHFLVAVEQADGLFQLESGSNQGDGQDPWSLNTKDEFSDLSNPNTYNYANLNTKTSVWGISAPDSIMTASFDISYSRPKFVLTSSMFSDASLGNNNGAAEPGETITFNFALNNLWLTTTNVTAEMYSDNNSIIFTTPSVNIGTVLGYIE